MSKITRTKKRGGRVRNTLYNTLMAMLGIVFIVAAVGAVVYWEVYGRETFTYQEVLVLRESVGKNTIITEEMLTWTKREEGSLIGGAVFDPQLLIGKESKHFIPANEQLLDVYFDEPSLVKDDDEFTFKIPDDWLEDIPQSLRRGDTVFVYPINVYETVDGVVETYKGIQGQPISELTVAYVKDSANREVQNLEDIETEERLTGSSTVSMVEVIVTMEDVKKMEAFVDAGYEFVLLYQ